MDSYAQKLVEVILSVPPELVLLAAFVVSLLEAIVLVGLFVPGTVLISFLGVLAQQTQTPFWQVYIISVLASVIGWWISFFLGKKSQVVLKFSLFRNIFTPQRVKRSEEFFQKYGGISLLFARFLGPMRPVFPFAGGMFGLPVRAFWIWNGVSAFLWNLVYIGAGYLLGVFAIEYLETYSKAASVFSVFVALVVVLLSLSKFRIALARWFYKVYTLSSAYYKAYLKEIAAAILGFLLVALFYLLRLRSSELDFALYQGLGPVRDLLGSGILYKVIEFAGEWRHVLVLVVFVAAFYAGMKKKLEAVKVLLFGLSVIFSVFLLKNFLQVPRPWFGVGPLQDSFSYPSGHTAMAVVAAILLWRLLSEFIHSRLARQAVRFTLVVFVIATALQRVATGAHSLFDVLASLALAGGIWIAFSYPHFKSRFLKD